METTTFKPTGPTEVQTVTAPAPPAAEVESRFLGRLSFEDGYPTAETLERLYDELDFQRACQAFLRNIPALNMACFRLGLARDLGIDASNKFAIFTADANTLMLTPNSETVYGVTFLATDADGPTVVEVPPGMLGFANSMWMQPIEDIGPGGPDGGEGGKYLFVPPGYAGALPKEGYFVVPMPTYGAWFLLRAFRGAGGETKPAFDLLKQVRIYPLGKDDTQMSYVDTTHRLLDTTAPGDIRYFEMLAELVAREHDGALDPESAGLLRSIGIEKRKPFNPDGRMRGILTEAAQTGGFLAQSVSEGARNRERARDGSNWYAGLDGYPTFNTDNCTYLDEMIYMTWFATGAAKAMSAPKPGTGSQYMWTYKDDGGEWLQGEKNYRFRVAPNPPAKDFWSIVVYDNWTRAILPNGQAAASKSTYDQGLEANDDGSIDIFFGPDPPEGKEGNWIRTNPGGGWFALFRLYGPLEAWFNRTWTPDDIAEIR